MRSLTRSFLIALTAISLGWSVMSLLYARHLSEELNTLRRETSDNVIYLSARIRDLREELTLGSTVGGTSSTEEITLPVLNSPETVDPAAARYKLAEHEGLICLFDASGEIIRTLDVYVMTLPEADREALAVGIFADSWEEACELMRYYE